MPIQQEDQAKTRVLFVDDEQLILEGLANMFRAQRKKWDMVFVKSGHEALDELSKARFDVLVTDMRMPKMDGGALLVAVKQRHPHVVRIVLSGHAELETTLRAVPVAHQFLSKPCDSETLQNVVARACKLQSLLGQESFRRTVGTIDRLPSLPEVYFAVTKALENPRSSLKEVAKIVEKDLALSAKVLQLVNSSFFGLPKRTSSVSQAVNYLGADMLKRVLLSAEAFSSAEALAVRPGFLETLQNHSMLTARLTSKIFESGRPEDAFIAGMLHDIGRLIFVACFPQEDERVEELSASGHFSLHDSENEILGVNHAQLGAYLLDLWGLPYPIVEAVAHHHEPSVVPHDRFELVDAVFVADILTHDFTGREEPEILDGATSLSEHLRTFGLEDKLPQWTAMAEQICHNEGGSS